MYDLDMDRAIKAVKDKNAKSVCLQLPDGLKPKGKEIADQISKATDAKVILWAGSCFGACDFPDLGNKVDLLIQWGHSKWD